MGMFFFLKATNNSFSAVYAEASPMVLLKESWFAIFVFTLKVDFLRLQRRTQFCVDIFEGY